MTIYDDLKRRIRDLLDERRPDRYVPGDGDTDRWLDELAEEVAPDVPPAEAQQLAARALVGRAEGVKTRDTNKILRESVLQPPLDWEFFRALPLVVGNERVAIRACGPEDFDQFAREERARNAAEFLIREETSRGAEYIAGFMRTSGVLTASDLRW